MLLQRRGCCAARRLDVAAEGQEVNAGQLFDQVTHGDAAEGGLKVEHRALVVHLWTAVGVETIGLV